MQEKYKKYILFAAVSGRKNVVCFRNMADWIINDQWHDNKWQNGDDEAKRIIETATKIIKNELKEFLQSNPCYPSIDNVKIGWISDHLRLFFSSFIHSELKVETIEQCFMKVTMLRSVMPHMLFAIAVKPNHMSALGWLNTQLFSLGFAESYNEVIRFKQGLLITGLLTIFFNHVHPKTISSLLLVTMLTTILPPLMGNEYSMVWGLLQ